MPPSKARLLAQALAAVAVLLSAGRGFGADAPVAETPDDTLGNVLQRGDTVISFTQSNFYVGSLKDRMWKKMETPQWMLPLKGTLLQQGPDSPLLVFRRQWRDYKNPMPKDFVTLAISKDAGRTWEATTKGRTLDQVFVGASGYLFAIERSQMNLSEYVRKFHGMNLPTSVLWSQDLGMTWKDVTPDLPKGQDVAVEELSQDHNHPDLVHLSAVLGMHPWGGEFEADDTNFKWRRVELDDNINEQVAQSFAWPRSGGMRLEYNIMVPPTLSTYFTPPYLKSEGMPIAVIQLETSKPAYTFRADEPKIIPVKVVYLDPRHSLEFLDLADETVFWNLIMLRGGAETFWQPGVLTKIGDGFNPQSRGIPDRQKNIDAILHDPALLTVKLDSAHPYERTIDLSKFHDFSTPGTYKLNVTHNDRPVLKNGGDFAGGGFEVTITP